MLFLVSYVHDPFCIWKKILRNIPFLYLQWWPNFQRYYKNTLLYIVNIATFHFLLLNSRSQDLI